MNFKNIFAWNCRRLSVFASYSNEAKYLGMDQVKFVEDSF